MDSYKKPIQPWSYVFGQNTSPYGREENGGEPSPLLAYNGPGTFQTVNGKMVFLPGTQYPEHVRPDANNRYPMLWYWNQTSQPSVIHGQLTNGNIPYGGPIGGHRQYFQHGFYPPMNADGQILPSTKLVSGLSKEQLTALPVQFNDIRLSGACGYSDTEANLIGKPIPAPIANYASGYPQRIEYPMTRVSNHVYDSTNVPPTPVFPQEYQTITGAPVFPRDYQTLASNQAFPRDYQTLASNQPLPREYQPLASNQAFSRDYQTLASNQPLPREYQPLASNQAFSPDYQSLVSNQPLPREYQPLASNQAFPRDYQSLVSNQPLPREYQPLASNHAIPQEYQTFTGAPIFPRDYQAFTATSNDFVLPPYSGTDRSGYGTHEVSELSPPAEDAPALPQLTPLPEEHIRRVEKVEVVEVPREVTKYVPKIETKIVEQIVEVPGPEKIPVPRPYYVNVPMIIPKYEDRNIPLIVSQNIVPEIQEVSEAIEVEVVKYEPEVSYVDVYVPRPVAIPIRATGEIEQKELPSERVTQEQLQIAMDELNPHLHEVENYNAVQLETFDSLVQQSESTARIHGLKPPDPVRRAIYSLEDEQPKGDVSVAEAKTVENIDTVKNVDTVGNIDTVGNLIDTAGNIDTTENIDVVENVDIAENIDTDGNIDDAQNIDDVENINDVENIDIAENIEEENIDIAKNVDIAESIEYVEAQ